MLRCFVSRLTKYNEWREGLCPYISILVDATDEVCYQFGAIKDALTRIGGADYSSQER
jgi:hypothetical protein